MGYQASELANKLDLALAIVTKAVTVEGLAGDVEIELADFFPRHSDLSLQAGRLLMHVENTDQKRQSELGRAGHGGALTEQACRVTGASHQFVRRLKGTDKIVSTLETK